MRPNYKSRRINAQLQRSMRKNLSDEQLAARFERVRLMSMQRTAFNGKDLAPLALAQWPDRPELAAAFARCTVQWLESDKYTYLVDPFKPELWRYAGGVTLECPVLGSLNVDVLEDGSIGGIEFMDAVMGRPTSAEALQRALRAMAPGARNRAITG